jgi:hypothetical protein
MPTDKEQNKASAYGKVIAKAWRDPAFKAKLVANPKAVLTEAGVTFPADATVRVVENTATHVHLVLPAKPTGALSEEALDNVAAGACYRGQSHVLHCGKDDAIPDNS